MHVERAGQHVKVTPGVSISPQFTPVSVPKSADQVGVTAWRPRESAAFIAFTVVLMHTEHHQAQPIRPQLRPEELSIPKQRICVTGATGYVGSHVVKRLLAAGHTVHAPVRSRTNSGKHDFLLQLPGASDGLKLFYGADLLRLGSFDAAVAGCDIVIHTASPYILNVPKGSEWELVIDPAVKGTENVLTSVNNAPSVKRVIITSSTTAVFSDPHERGENHTFTEADWNFTATPEEPPYFYSKRASEQRAYAICQEQQRWKLCSIVPGSVWGPPLSPHMTSSESVSHMVSLMNGLMWPAAPPLGMAFIDVRDLAAAHCLAMVRPESSGRYLVASGTFWPFHFASQVLKHRLENSSQYWLPITVAPLFLLELFGPLFGVSASVVKAMYKKTPRLSCQRAVDELGLQSYIDPEDTVLEMAQEVIRLNLL